MKSGASGMRRAWLLAIAAVFAAIYLLPLYAPPGTTAIALDLPHRPDLGARLFPGIPFAWMAGRLTAVAIATVALAYFFAQNRLTLPPPIRATAAIRPKFVWLALLSAAMLAGFALAAHRLPVSAEFVFLLLAPLPTLLTALAHRRRKWPTLSPSGCATLLLIAFWALERTLNTWGDPRAATTIDTWPGFESFADAVMSGRKLLSVRFEPGAPDLIHLLVGAPLCHWFGIEPSLVWVRAMTMLWLAAGAAAIHVLARQIAGPAAGVVAAAALLYAPFTFHDVIDAAPYGVVTALIVGMFLAFYQWIASRSPTALVALASLAGIASAFGHSAVPTALLGLVTAISLVQRRKDLAPTVLAVAVLTFGAIAYPHMPGLGDLESIQVYYLARFQPWLYVESWLFGQRVAMGDVAFVERNFAWLHVHTLEIFAGALLAPVAIARNALRHCGDVFIEPLSALLGIAGILVLLTAKHRGNAALLLYFLLIALLPGFTSSYDRVSLVRLMNLVPVFSLLAAVGFAALAPRPWRQHTGVGIACAAAIAFSGAYLSEYVNPRIVAQSWMSIALASIETSGESQVALLDAPPADRFEWLYTEIIAAKAGVAAVPVHTFASPASLSELQKNDVAVAFWSPAFEIERQPSAALCAVAPTAQLIRIWDPAHLSYTWAAAFDGTWRPPLESARWEVTLTCSDVPT